MHIAGKRGDFLAGISNADGRHIQKCQGPVIKAAAIAETIAVPVEADEWRQYGSWDDDPEALRSAVRRGSDKDWKQQDPQLPQSVWYYTDALFAGFRVVRPLQEPPEELKNQYGADDTTRR